MGTIFDKIVSGEMKAWVVWEDDKYMAFLTPFPNTPGFTVVIPKINVGDYIFSLKDKDYQGLMSASRIVAKKLERAFDTPRVAMIVEGTGVAHVHVKLVPLHGELAGETDVWSKHTEFNETYLGYISSVEGPKMDDEKLDEIQKRIIET
jgi:diadenosine tetraphosphate (Ap4A) HIT family hydrolase